MPPAVQMITRFFVRATGGTRYAASLGTLVVVLIYAVMNRLDLWDNYADLAAAWGLPRWLALTILALLTFLILGGLWNWLVFSGAVDDDRLLQARPIYRMTDRQGLLSLNFSVMCLVLVIVSYAAERFAVRINTDVMVFLGLLVAGPLLLDYAPWTRPRRLVIGLGARSLLDVAQLCQRGSTSTTEVIARRLATYNELTARISQTVHPELFDGIDLRLDQPLPTGLLLEIPPRV